MCLLKRTQTRNDFLEHYPGRLAPRRPQCHARHCFTSGHSRFCPRGTNSLTVYFPALHRPVVRTRDTLRATNRLRWLVASLAVRREVKQSREVYAPTSTRVAHRRKIYLLALLLFGPLRVTPVCIAKTAPPTPPSRIFH